MAYSAACSAVIPHFSASAAISPDRRLRQRLPFRFADCQKVFSDLPRDAVGGKQRKFGGVPAGFFRLRRRCGFGTLPFAVSQGAVRQGGARRAHLILTVLLTVLLTVYI
ncbi:hypothetical protein [Neisseria gonorrhoeae]|uniref:hypothetical protein n=1 Tax=Neisseria gonorrhoeae TaxID=485 RepID=UPI00387B1527